MKPYLASVAPLCLLFAGLALTTPAPAQQPSGQTSPPKVLEIITEHIKPGQSGSPHAKTEAAFVQAMRQAQSPEHYIGLDAVTGSSRSIFLLGYDSFAGLQKDMDDTRKNASLAKAMDEASIADGALLDGYKTSIYRFRSDLSLREGADIGNTRYFEIAIFRIRSGHEQDWDKLVKMYHDASEKIPGVHWDTFEEIYGNDRGAVFLVATPMKSLSEVDEEMTYDKKMAAVVSPEQLQKMRDFSSATVESVESNLYAINPKMSYARPEWTKAAPTFWGQ
jgi:hypothetical protein